MNARNWVPFLNNPIHRQADVPATQDRRVWFGAPALAPIILALLTSPLATSPAAGQCPFDWRPSEGMPGVDGAVYAATTWDPDGAGPLPELLIVGGSFTIAGNVLANNIAAWNGTTWQPLGTGLSGSSNPIVFALTIYNGELIAGGQFWTAGGVPARNTARWNGTAWQPLAVMNGTVYALSVYHSELIVAGGFTTAGGVPASGIARWNGTAWQPLGTGMNGQFPHVDALTVCNGELTAGGYFTTAGGVSAIRIARWNGAAWQPLGGTGMNNRVYALTVYDGELIAGGDFTVAGSVTAYYIARWNGAAWQPLGTGMNNRVSALTVYNDELVAGGDFTTAGGASANYIARWKGATWQPLGTGMSGGISYPPSMYALTVYNGELIAGGDFTTAGGVSANHIARWNGAAWQPLGTGMNWPASALTVYKNELIAGGASGPPTASPVGTVRLGSRWEREWESRHTSPCTP